MGGFPTSGTGGGSVATSGAVSGTGAAGDPLTVGTGAIGDTEIASTTVAAGSYGAANSVATFTVNADGRVTAAETVGIDITSGQVSGLGNAATRSVGTTSNTVAAGDDARFTQIQGVAVDATAPTNGQVLTYNSGSGKWAPASVGGGGALTDGTYGSGTRIPVLSVTGGVITGAAEVAASGTTNAPEIWNSLVDAVLDGSATANSNASLGYTMGLRFRVTQSGKICTGIRFYAGGAMGSITAQLWDSTSTGAPIKTATVNVTGSGEWTATFASSQSLTRGRVYGASIYIPNGTNVWIVTGTWITAGTQAGPALQMPYGQTGYYSTGAAAAWMTTNWTNTLAIEPKLQ